ncbi:MAG TPA: hypothetical protein VF584_09970 [Longimicrobium sp.]|jgi:hypothetical protein
MDNYEPIDALRLKDELQERVNRALAGLTSEERIRWIREEAAKYRSENPARPPDEARKTA